MTTQETIDAKVSRLDERTMIIMRDLSSLRSEMNGRFQVLDTITEKSAQLRIQRWSLVIASLGGLSSITSITVILFKALGH